MTDLERKLRAQRKFLDEMTTEREQEREEFQRSIKDLSFKYEETRKEKERLESVADNLRMEVMDLEDVLHQKELVEHELVDKIQISEIELKRAIDKVS